MRPALLVVCAVAVLVIAYSLWPEPPSTAKGGALEVTELLGAADASGFERAQGQRTFVFPDDHGPHSGYRTEWWYFTGNLSAADGGQFGYQLTFFRNALLPAQNAGASAWATNELYMAHFALSDLTGQRFFANERFSRAALGLAGAQAEPFRVWLEDWEATGDGGFFPLSLRAKTHEAAISLTLHEGKPLVLQGDNGLSPKGPERGNASWYYSFTRMATRGEVRTGNDVFAVTGESWMDREWSTSGLGRALVGWDWFALQLETGEDLMLYQLRTRDGGMDPFSAGTFVAQDGGATPLEASGFTLTPQRYWTSPRGGTRYPVAWRAEVPSLQLSVEVEAALPDQELELSVRYWEGAVRVRGTMRDAPVQGRGYLELTGYASGATSGRGR